jgi:hypothetical protein
LDSYCLLSKGLKDSLKVRTNVSFEHQLLFSLTCIDGS